ncbi:MAG: pyridoxamine 5'-phosphate oxidase family protein [Dehalococcoidia bacterium]|nr:pyridoxamine 5'-phosphate oxidase family protein [Dehalococcoidia bacterium]
MTEPDAQASKREAFIAEPRTAVFSTVDARGRSHAIPVWYLWKDDEFRVVTERGSQKHKNAERSGRAALTIVDGPRYVAAEGPVRVVDPLSYEERLALHIHYRGAEAAEKSTADGAHVRMVLLVLTPERWLGMK